MQKNAVLLKEKKIKFRKKGEAILSFVEKKYQSSTPTNTEYIIDTDIGGTNSNFGIFKNVNRKLPLFLSLHFKK